jgi:diguanylate cyclase (GGDEF)-like protein
MNADAHVAEDQRLAALDRYDVLDTPSEPSFDRITRIAMNALEMPMAAVTLIDGHRQWFKSKQGMGDDETCKSRSFCNVAIRSSEPLIVEDAAIDPRFKDNAAVVGAPYVRSYAGAQLCTADGYNLGALCAFDVKPRRFSATHVALLQDLACMVMSEFEARKLARTDSLTGALTRGGFRDEAERAIALSSRHRHALSCIAFDLDHFKKINDAHGHAAGDRVLVEAVGVCRERLRNSDILGRLGGEEFAIVLPHTDAAGAFKVAEEIRTALEQRAIAATDTAINVSASFGVAPRDHADVALDELLRRADIALYSAKDAGRNTCMAWRCPPGAANLAGMRRVLKSGQIVFNAGRSVIDCTVRGLCDTAASLDVVSTAGIPEHFKLAILGDDFSRVCAITVKQGRRIEVAFA